MENTKKKSPPNFRGKIATFLILIMGAALVWLWIDRDKKQLDPEWVEQLETLKAERSAYDRLLEADQMALSGKYGQALETYKELLHAIGEDKQSMVSARIDRMEQRLSNTRENDTSAQANRLLIEHLQDSVSGLRSVIDSLRSHSSLTVENSAEQLAEMRRNLEEKNRLLSQRDRLQVISFTVEGDKKIYYLGEVANGKANGGGVGIWAASGSVYRGDWKDNQRHGKGSFEWTDGTRYQGDFYLGRREGQGTYYWPSGERYEGEWYGSKQNGFGILYDPDGNIKFEGNWADGKPVRK